MGPARPASLTAARHPRPRRQLEVPPAEIESGPPGEACGGGTVDGTRPPLDRAEEDLRAVAALEQCRQPRGHGVADAPEEDAVVVPAFLLLALEDVLDRLTGLGAETGPAERVGDHLRVTWHLVNTNEFNGRTRRA